MSHPRSRARRPGLPALGVAALLSLTVACAPTPEAPAASPAPTTAAADPTPTPTPSPTPTTARTSAEARVDAMDLRERAASVVMGHVATTDPATAGTYVRENALGGFLLMGANIGADAAEVRRLTGAMVTDPAFPPLVAVDQEGGDVSRLRWDDLPSALTLKDASPETVRDAFAGRAALVADAGANANFGLVADVTDDPGMFIYRRALGTTPEAAATRIAAAVEGEKGTVASTLKHFPGHGAAPGDSHEGIPGSDMSIEQWRQTQAPPFVAGVDAGAEMLMFGHLRYTAVDDAPASLSPEWHRIAREELGFDGVIVSDDLGMLESSGEAAYTDPVDNAVQALAAGTDLVLTVVGTDATTAPRIVDGIVAAVEDGRLPADRLDDAAARVAALRLDLASGAG
ncbi:glycoside hydrolase family 3 N-terminal domain-containing protein [Microbacterium sp. HMH0099]|uniref:glycoside hydrolase family 3 N-terminal domain-containing protein n=1 Tax=Microbacterium sp. HMH0099 TaxID=3414026 RepID=UPI003BF704D8